MIEMFKTLKVVGISGTGKSTLINAIRKKLFDLSHVSYSKYLEKYGCEANNQLKKSLLLHEGLVLMDEHLEFDEEDIRMVYREENTCGIFFLEVSPWKLINMRKRDYTRIRDINREKIVFEQKKVKEKALFLSISLDIPMLIVKDGDIDKNVFLLKQFVNSF